MCFISSLISCKEYVTSVQKGRNLKQVIFWDKSLTNIFALCSVKIKAYVENNDLYVVENIIHTCYVLYL